jgi:hypothetical protein
MTVERTRSSSVFEFTIGKRGKKSGWTPDRFGYYRRYFTHSKSGALFWALATEAEIAAANSGMLDEDFAQIFKGDTDLTLETITRRFRHFHPEIREGEINDLLENLVARDRLTTREIDNERTWRVVRNTVQENTAAQRMADVLFFVEESGTTGIITGTLREMVPFGHARLKEALEALKSEGKIRAVKEGSSTVRYFPTRGLVTDLQKAASQSRRRAIDP